MRQMLGILAAAGLLAACGTTTQPQATSSTVLGIAGLGAGNHAATGGTQAYLGYLPIDPVMVGDYTVYDKQPTGSPKVWPTRPGDIRVLLANQSSSTVIKSVDAQGKLSFLSASTTVKAGSYEVVMDYAKYRSEPIFSQCEANVTGCAAGGRKLEGWGKVGVGVRIRANVVAIADDTDLNGLMALGLSAKVNKLTGMLSVDVIGIDSKKTNALLPVGVQLDQSSIQAALQSLATLQSRIYDDDVTLTPHILAFKDVQPVAASSDAADVAKREADLLRGRTR